MKATIKTTKVVTLVLEESEASMLQGLFQNPDFLLWAKDADMARELVRRGVAVPIDGIQEFAQQLFEQLEGR